jgi:hypothetical protein
VQNVPYRDIPSGFVHLSITVRVVRWRKLEEIAFVVRFDYTRTAFTILKQPL